MFRLICQRPEKKGPSDEKVHTRLKMLPANKYAVSLGARGEFNAETNKRDG